MDAQSVDPNRAITVELNAQEWNLVHMGLNELPAKLVRRVLGKLEAQLDQVMKQEA